MDIEIFFAIITKLKKHDKNSQLVFKMFFDCLNEFLDEKRLFGLNGNPYPQKLLSSPHKFINLQFFEKVFINIKEKLRSENEMKINNNSTVFT